MLRAPEGSTRTRLLDDVQIFVIETGIAESVLGRRAVQDSRIIARLRAGKDVTTANLDRIYAFMAAERAKRAGGPQP